MMQRAAHLRASPLEHCDLDDLPADVTSLLRWKYDAVTQRRLTAAEHTEAGLRWLRDVLEVWGTCGQVLRDGDEEVVAVVLYAPESFLPGLAEMPTAPASSDAVVICDLFVRPPCGDAGVGKALIHAVAKDLTLRDVAAVEAFGSRHVDSIGHSPELPTAEPPTLRVDFLESVGFVEHRSHPRHPRFRMDLRGARTWMDDLELAWTRLVTVVRPRRAVPATNDIGPATSRVTGPTRRT